MDTTKGYLKLFRRILEWEWYDNPFVKSIFLHCVICANNTTKEWRDIKLKRGQFVTSYEKLAAVNGMTIQQTRTALKQLQLTHEIEYQSTNQYTVITVKNYDLYQATNTRNCEANIVPTNKRKGGQLTTTNNRLIDCNNNNNLSLYKEEFKKNEREILKKYLLNKRRAKPIEDIDAYISLLIKNGDFQLNLEKALKWQAKQEQKINCTTKKNEEPKEDKQLTDAGFQQFKEVAKKIAKRVKQGEKNG